MEKPRPLLDMLKASGVTRISVEVLRVVAASPLAVAAAAAAATGVPLGAKKP